MAAQHGYGKMAGTDALEFAYDTGDSRNSFIGEPTTNLVPYSEYQYLADGYMAALPGWDTHEGTMLIDVTNKVPGYTNRSIKLTCVQANVYKYHFSVPLITGQTYTISFWAKAQVAGNYDNFMLADGPGGYLVVQPSSITTLTTEFTRVKHTFNMAARETGTYNFATYLYGDGQVGWLSGFQVENKSHATQYLPSNGAATTRSVTQGLKDLTAVNTINLSTVSFDSNAQMVFDGTDDTIDTGIPLTSLPALSNFSIECMVKINSFPTAAPPNFYNSTTKAGILIGAAYYSGTALYWYGNSSGTACTVYAYIRGADAYRLAGEFSLTPGRYHHLVLVNNHSGGNFRLYANGTLNGSANGPTQEYNSGLAPSAGNIGIVKAQVDGGGESVYSLLPCEIPVAKIYNRALTANEVLQNFKKYQTRFGIA